MRPQVWVLGNLTIDDVVMPDGATTMGLCGGNAIYAAIGARRWQPRVGIAARIGPDYPRGHLAPIGDAGIRLALVEVEHPSMHNWALYESESTRRFVNWMNAGTHVEQSIRPDELPADAGSAAACHVAPMPLAIQASLVTAMRSRGVGAVSLDPHEEYVAGHEDALLALLGSVTIFLPSILEVRQLYGRDDPESAASAFLAAGPSVVVIKLGSDGSLVATPDGTVRHVPAIPVRALDTTGCGDAYCGGFLAAWDRGADALEAACHGTVSASFTAETRGAAGALPFDDAAADARLEQLRTLVRPLPEAESRERSRTEGATYAHG